MSAISCCKNCPNKGCGPYHDICEKYQEEKAALAEQKKRMRQEFQADLFLRNAAEERQIRYKKGI